MTGVQTCALPIYSWHVSILIDAWENSGKQVSASKPYISKAAVRESISNCSKKYSKGTVRNKLMEFNELQTLGRIEIYAEGWRVVDPVLISYFMLSME